MKLSKLVEHAQITIGQGAPQNADAFTSEGKPFIRAGSLDTLTSGGSLNSLEFISDDSAKKNKLKLYPANSVVFAKSGMSATKNRVYKLTQPCYVVSHLAILLPNEKTDPEYLRLILQYARPSTLIKDPSYPSIGQSDIENFKLPIPPLDDQSRIATVLTRAEKLIAKRKESIKALDEFLKSTFLEMFGDPLINAKDLTVKTLEDIAMKQKNAIVDGPFGSSLKMSDYYEDGIPIIRINNIRDEGFYNAEFKYISGSKYNELIRSKVIYNDILIARVGNTIGKTCVFNQHYKALLSTTGVAKVTLDDKIANNKFIIQQLRLPQYIKYIWNQTEGGGQPYLNLTKIKRFKILLPPIDHQNQYAAIVAKIESLKIKYTQSLTELESLYGSLSQRAFKGKLDLSRVKIVVM